MRRYKRAAFLALVASAVLAGNPASAAPPTYAEAVVLLKAGKWKQAHDALTVLAKSGCPANTLYLLGYAAAQLYDTSGTVAAEKKALSCAPPLSAKHAAEAQSLLNWAQARTAVIAMSKVNLTMSTDRDYDTPKKAAKKKPGKGDAPAVSDDALAAALAKDADPCASVKNSEQMNACAAIMFGVDPTSEPPEVTIPEVEEPVLDP